MPAPWFGGTADATTACVFGDTERRERPERQQMTIVLHTLDGTGTMLDLSRVNEWREMMRARISRFDIQMIDSDAARPDIRSAAGHLANIRRVFDPAITDLATTFGVSRQMIYKWTGNESRPEDKKLNRIRALSHAADAFREAGVTRASSLLKMKAFEGRSLLDLVATGQLLPEHTQTLIAEARAMEAACNRSDLARSKAVPSDDWRTELSIPGSLE
jgi:DNA-binding transcriptional regulator YiaG